MLRFLHARQREEEWMDAPNVDPAQLRRSLKFIRQINRLLGYTRVTIGYLKHFSKTWKPGETITILDVATGSGDIPRAILAWADECHFDVRITAVDLHAQTILVAANETKDLRAVRGDARNLPFPDKSIDYVHSAMFLHHLSETDAIAVLKEMDRVARRGIILTDLIRSKRAYAWITLFTLFANPMVIHDARVSVAQAFTKNEILELCRAAALDYVHYRRHFGHRFVIAGERTTKARSHEGI
jgi:ubiquinone/menaquinone biosynthesis C-methylase UbiE